MNNQFSFKRMFFKGVKYFCLFALPWGIGMFIEGFPEIASLTIGGILVMITNFIKFHSESMKV